jgi:hypothetical protein
MLIEQMSVACGTPTVNEIVLNVINNIFVNIYTHLHTQIANNNNTPELIRILIKYFRYNDNVFKFKIIIIIQMEATLPPPPWISV